MKVAKLEASSLTGESFSTTVEDESPTSATEHVAVSPEFENSDSENERPGSDNSSCESDDHFDTKLFFMTGLEVLH